MVQKNWRPTDNPKDINTRIRLSKNDADKLEYCSKVLEKPKAEIIRIGIDKVYQEVKK